MATKHTFMILSIVLVLLPNYYAYIPNVDELFSTLTEDNEFVKTINKPPDTLFKNISIDLEKLNLSIFTGKLKNMVGNMGNAESIGNVIEDDIEIPKRNETRRLAYIGNIYEWRNASKILVKNKLFDLMLQTIYMTRHKIKQVEDEAYYNPTDTSYRIAFLYRRLRRIWKKMLDVYTTMQRKRRSRKKVFKAVNPFLILHHKAAKLHVDFLYLWWLLIKMHERYDYRHGITKFDRYSRRPT